MLYLRIKKLIKYLVTTQISLGEELGVNGRTFVGYLKKGRDYHLWELLPTLLDLYPRLSRQWLYFGEGPMFIGFGIPIEIPVPLQILAGAAKEIADDAKSTDSTMWKYIYSVLDYQAKEEAYADAQNEEIYLDSTSNKTTKKRHGTEPPTLSQSIINRPVPVVGLASCGLLGIEQIMPYPVTASPIYLSPRSVAVIASGESMVPAGIASGHTCFCDPDQTALPGEAVFLRKKDGKGALKLFLGKGEKEGYLAFKGWLSEKDDKGHQKEFLLDIPKSEIDYIAPVIFIKRRL